YFLGDHFEGIPLGPVRVGAQLTPPRMHILTDAAERMPVRSDGFAASMSLARGGLGAGWSAGVFPFTGHELGAMGRGPDERGPYAYLDLDDWAGMDRSVYRPQWTLEELQRAPNFTYLKGRFVHAFSEDEPRVRVRATRADSGEEETHEAAAVVLAGGTLGTARIVLASLGAYDRPVPILCNAYAYVPTLNLGMLRRPARGPRSRP